MVPPAAVTGSPELAGLVVCGCCYGAVTEGGAGGRDNFPLSRAAAELGLGLGRCLRERACHQVC